MAEDRDKEKKIERANAYRDMMRTWAWKDFVENILNHSKNLWFSELALIDPKHVNEMTGQISFTLGKVKAIDSIVSEVDYITAEGAEDAKV